MLLSTVKWENLEKTETLFLEIRTGRMKGKRLKLEYKAFSLDIRRVFFPMRAITYWNRLL